MGQKRRSLPPSSARSRRSERRPVAVRVTSAVTKVTSAATKVTSAVTKVTSAATRVTSAATRVNSAAAKPPLPDKAHADNSPVTTAPLPPMQRKRAETIGKLVSNHEMTVARQERNKSRHASSIS